MTQDEDTKSAQREPALFRTVLTALAPALAVAAVFLAEGHFYGRFDISSEQLELPPLPWRADVQPLAVVTRDFLARVTLRLSGATLVLLWFSVMGLAVHVVLRSTLGRRLARGIALTLPVLGSAVVLWETSHGKTYTLIATLRELLEAFFRYTGVTDVTELENVLSGVIISALLFLTTAVCAVLAMEPAADAEALRQRFRRLRDLLYVGATMLVVGILHTNQLLQWPVAFLGGEEAKILRGLADGYSAVTGFYWTLLLLALYLPASLLLQREGRRLAAETLDDATLKERREWLAQEKLAPPLFEQMRHLAAVLGPFLAGGPLAALINLGS